VSFGHHFVHLVFHFAVIVPKPAETSTIGNQIPQDPLHPEDTLPLREKRNKEIREKLQDIVLDRLRVSLGEILQEGTFGKIYEGVVTGPEDGEGQNVFVKTVSGTLQILSYALFRNMITFLSHHGENMQ
jgi:hypothetical protein